MIASKFIAALGSRRWLPLTVLTLLLGGMASASAQISLDAPGAAGMPGGRGGHRQGPQQETRTAPVLAPLPPVKEPWPRLEAGAVLCKSRDDLVRYQTKGMAGPPPDCHGIRQRMAIQILDRDGLSHTHVVATDDAKQTGWTNAYLPVSPPPSATTATPPATPAHR